MSAESTAAKITQMSVPSSADNAKQTPPPPVAALASDANQEAKQAPAPPAAAQESKVNEEARPVPVPPAAAQANEAKGKSPWRALIPIVILLMAAGIIFAITGNWNSWAASREIQETDDANLRADLTPLSTRVSGTVAQVAVNDYQKVKAGDLLVQLKDDDYRAQVEQAEAGVRAGEAAIENNQRQKALQDAHIDQAQAGIEAAKAQVAQAQAAIEASKAQIIDAEAAIQATKADVVRTEAERRRQESLVEASAATKQRLEQVVADAERFRSILASREAGLQQAHAGLAVRKSDLAQAEAALLGRNADWEAQRRGRAVLDAQEGQLRADLSARQAGLKVAETNLEYTRIVAPTDGIVGERKVRAGQLVSPGTQALALVQSEPWVLANYKETQLTNVRKGDPVEITVDGLPGVTIKGHVEEIAPASGSQFALLPPDNATGNFTKIAQRIPVKIVLDADPSVRERLRPGMSVISKIKTGGARDSKAAAAGGKQ
jgi:membrane fusion protein (multidrug efflux system)